jgi:hypothetical protein
MSVTSAELIGGSLCISYVVTGDVRPEAPGGSPYAECPCGIAIGEGGVVYRECTSALMTRADGSRAFGMIRIGPSVPVDAGAIRIVFVPLAQLAGVSHTFCEMTINVEDGCPVPLSVRWV